MRCPECNYTMPYTALDDKRCPSCGDHDLEVTAEDWLSEPTMGLVREVRPGQIALTNIIDDALRSTDPQIVIAQGGCGVGKAQPLNAKILCPDGWKCMGDMKVGTPIIGRDGHIYAVTGVFPQGKREVFQVAFTDGAQTPCCKEHLWLVQSKNDRAKRRPGRVRRLEDLVLQGLKTGREHNHWTPIMEPAQFPGTAPLPLDPYTLGVLLGDGGFTGRTVTLTKKTVTDLSIVEELRRRIPAEDQITQMAQEGAYHIISRTVGRWSRSRTLDILQQLGLWGHLSIEKFIPPEYLWAGVDDRLALLQGLCDTDGGNLTTNIEYSSSSERLAEDVRFLVRSLGGVTSFNSRIPKYTHNGEKRDGHRSYRLVFTLPPALIPYRLPRKRDAYHVPTKYFPRRAITRVESIGEQETQCIAVSAPDQLYVTDDFIVTHNTFSYLAPALLTGKRVIVSTAKKSLQGQLDSKDLPYLHQHMGRPRSFTSIKGRGNYLCRLYLRKQKEALPTDLYDRLDRFLAENRAGDLDAFPGGMQGAMWSCTANECVGVGCSFASDCGYRKAKARAKVDQVVVVNHALLGFDLRFGPQRLLGEYDILIIDEAHAAEDFFRGAFSREISINWMARTLGELHKQNIQTSLDDKAAKKEWRELFDRVPKQEVLSPNFFGDIKPAHRTLQVLLENIETHLQSTELLCAEAVAATMSPAATKANADTSLLDATSRAAVLETLKHRSKDDQNDGLICLRLADKITEMQAHLHASTDPSDNTIRVREELQGRQEGFKVVMKPIDIGRMVGPKLKSLKKVIFTSATLQADLLERDLGIKAHQIISQPSPFNYKANGLVYIPKHIPNPSTLNGDKTPWIEAIGKEVVQLIKASNGNGLVLFTSLKEMEDVLNYIEDNYDVKQPIFAQGAGRRSDEVFADFMKTDNSVLFGSKSFFEGVDVQGEKLRLVILTKLPFPIWGDPIVQAKKQQLGDRHFAQYYLPKMFTDLMQAGGRLIRTASDRGVFAILDPRMWVGSNKKIDPEKIRISNGCWPGYGNQAFQQLPFTNVTPNFSMTQKFLTHIQNQH